MIPFTYNPVTMYNVKHKNVIRDPNDINECKIQRRITAPYLELMRLNYTEKELSGYATAIEKQISTMPCN